MSCCKRMLSIRPIFVQKRSTPSIVIGWCGMFTKRLPLILYEYAISNGSGDVSAVSYALNVVPSGTCGIEWASVTVRVSPELF